MCSTHRYTTDSKEYLCMHKCSAVTYNLKGYERGRDLEQHTGSNNLRESEMVNPLLRFTNYVVEIVI